MRSEIILIAAVGAAAIGAFVYQGSSEPAPVAKHEPAPAAPKTGAAPPLDAVEGKALPPGHPPLDAGPGHASGSGSMPPGHPPTGDMPPGHPPTGDMPTGHPTPSDATPAAEAITPLEGGVTVGQLYADPQLDGRKVKLVARVVKVTPNVLGKTWLHVQDGTGDASRHQNDLVVTTSSQTKIGDVVVLEGLVVRDRDLGSGYRYEVLLEDATVRIRSEGAAEVD